jgi:hypothetical protein
LGLFDVGFGLLEIYLETLDSKLFNESVAFFSFCAETLKKGSKPPKEKSNKKILLTDFLPILNFFCIVINLFYR